GEKEILESPTLAGRLGARIRSLNLPARQAAGGMIGGKKFANLRELGVGGFIPFRAEESPGQVGPRERGFPLCPNQKVRFPFQAAGTHLPGEVESDPQVDTIVG